MHSDSDVASTAISPFGGDSDGDHSKPSNNEKIHHGISNGTMDIQTAAHEEISGAICNGKEGDKFRTMSRWDTLFALVTNQFGLGALGLPSAIKVLGVVPGIITITLAALLTWYSGYGLYEFYIRYPHVVNIVEMVKIVGGRPWEVIVAVLLLIQCIMTCASTAVTLSIAFNNISDHAMCTVGFIGIACIVCYGLNVPRTAKFVSQSGLPCMISIVAAALTVMISLGISNPPNAPDDWKATITIVGKPSFKETFNAVLKIIFAFAGNYAYVSYMAEMKNPQKDFPFALRGLICVSWIFYTTLAVAIYCLAGEYTTSPALGSAPRMAAKVAYGLVLPAILTAGLANGHVGVKYIFIEIMRLIKAGDQITSNGVKPWSIWLACATVFWIISFILSNAIPVFDSIVSISSATTYAWFTYGIAGALWLSWNRGNYFNGWKQMTLVALNVFLIVFALFMNGAGLWSSVTALLDTFASGDGVRGSFSCADNSV